MTRADASPPETDPMGGNDLIQPGFSLGRRRCTAHNRSGQQCHQPTEIGAMVCRYHGGAAPQVRRKAALRLAQMIDPAMTVLAREMTSTTNRPADRLRAVENVLDRAGVPRTVEVDNDSARALLVERLLELQAAAPVIDYDGSEQTGPVTDAAPSEPAYAPED